MQPHRSNEVNLSAKIYTYHLDLHICGRLHISEESTSPDLYNSITGSLQATWHVMYPLAGYNISKITPTLFHEDLYPVIWCFSLLFLRFLLLAVRWGEVRRGEAGWGEVRWGEVRWGEVRWGSEAYPPGCGFDPRQRLTFFFFFFFWFIAELIWSYPPPPSWCWKIREYLPLYDGRRYIMFQMRYKLVFSLLDL